MRISSWFSQLLIAPMTLNNLRNVLVMQLRDLASAEDQLIENLPKMAEGASSPALKRIFEAHLHETTRQRDRLDQAFLLLGEEPLTVRCEAMQGLIAEGNEILSLEGDPDVKDAALIAAAQRIEHYEIAGYGCARTFATRLNEHKVAMLLVETLAEEKMADEKLTSIAETAINAAAATS